MVFTADSRESNRGKIKKKKKGDSRDSPWVVY